MAELKAAFAVTLEDGISPNARKAKASIDSMNASLAGAGKQLSSLESLVPIPKELSTVFSGLGAGAGSVAIAFGVVGAAAIAAKAAIMGVVDVTESLVVKSLEVVNTNQKMAATFEALGVQGPGSGKKTLAMLDDLATKLPQSREQLAEWTKHLEAMGVTDLGKIRSELIATASAQAIMGDEGAAAYEKIQQRVALAVEAHHGLKLAEKSLKALYSAGVNMTDIADRMGMSTKDLSAKLKAGTIDAEKFGNALSATVKEKGRGPLDVMMNSLDTLKRKGMETIGHLFDGIDTKPLTDALRNLIALGDQGEPSGRAMKMGITGAMNAIIRMIGHGITEAEVFFLRLEVGALEAYIALKPIIGAVSSIASAMGTIGGALGAGKEKAAAGVGGALGLSPDAAQGAGDRVGQQMVFGLGGPLAQMSNLVGMMVADFANAKALAVAQESGKAIGQATVAGMREGVQAHSPSVAAIKIGMDLGAGLGMGLESSPAPERAARTISGSALGGLAQGGGGLFGAGGAQNTNSVGSIVVNITAPAGVTDAHEISVAGLSAALERYQIASGR